MSNENNRFTELCTGHVLNALSDSEEKKFQQLLADANEDQLALYDELKAVAAEMATLAPAERPSLSVKESIMQMATGVANSQSGKTGPANVNRMRWYRVAVAASFIFIFTSIGLLFYSQSLEEDMRGQSQTIAQQQTTIEQLESEVQRKEELLTILEAREVDLVMMAGMENTNPNGYGKVVWDKQGGRALLQVANMPAVPTDKDYQLWFIVNGQPISAGVFAVDDPQRDNFFKIEQLQSDAREGAFAITMEPKGGVPQPTGDMYLLGNM
ncbi:anti-sigma factor [Gracilimonas sp. BCB1]|uniref:anti-sigma factor n=1 Tax=Gracilimonas sp. BCB1 TaxID=3152362 RepID=UPI0032D997B1